MPAKISDNKQKASSIIAKSDDGTIQITFTIPYSEIERAQEEVAKEIGKDIEVPGFRKGLAPVTKVIEHVSKNTLLEKTLSKILPKLTADAINEYKIKPAIYPKFELIKATEGEDWQIRAITCEIPDIDLGNYKQAISSASKVSSIWTPGKNLQTEKTHKESEDAETREEKEQKVIKTLLETVKITIPKILIEEEVNSRLSKLLERLEKLALTLESYLASINKTAETLRREYEEQARNALALDLILTEIAKAENMSVDPKDVDKAIDAAQADPKLAKELDTPERKKFIEVILLRRKALDSLISLV